MRIFVRVIVLAVLATLVACDSGTTEPGAPAPSPAAPVRAAVLGSVPVLDKTTGHRYDAIGVAGGITWSAAKTAAEALVADGCPGMLASIGSGAENAFIVANLPAVIPPVGRGYWLGGYQPDGSPEPAGGWTWVDGQPFGYTNWLFNEPNDLRVASATGEDAVHYYDGGRGKWNDLPGWQKTPGYVVEFEPCATEIPIEVTVGSGDAKPVNPRSQGVVGVVVLTTATADGEAADFIAEEVDPESATLGDGEGPEAGVARDGQGRPMMTYMDADADGDTDMMLHFRTQELVVNGDLDAESVLLVLLGETWDGHAFRGSGAVRIVP